MFIPSMRWKYSYDMFGNLRLDYSESRWNWHGVRCGVDGLHMNKGEYAKSEYIDLDNFCQLAQWMLENPEKDVYEGKYYLPKQFHSDYACQVYDMVFSSRYTSFENKNWFILDIFTEHWYTQLILYNQDGQSFARECDIVFIGCLGKKPYPKNY